MSRRRRLLAISALLAFGAALGVAPIVVAPALADGVLEIATPESGSTHTWDANPNGFHVTGTTSDLANNVQIFAGATFLGSCTPDGLGAFDCGVAFPYPGPHTINALQGETPHDSISVTVDYPAMSAPLTGFTVNAVEGESATFSGQAALYSAGYEFGYVSVDFGGPTGTCQDEVDDLSGLWDCNVSTAGIETGSYPVEIHTTGGPATGVITTGTLTIAPYVVPVPVIDQPEPAAHLTTAASVNIGGTYDFGSLTASGGGFVTVTVVSGETSLSYCGSDYYPYTATGWTCLIPVELGMNSVTAVVTEDVGGLESLPSTIYVVGRGTSGPVTLDTPSDGAVIAGGASILFSGTGPVLSMPTVEIREYPTGPWYAWCYGNVIGALGGWNCPPSTTLQPGEWEVRVTTEDVNGEVTMSAPIRVTQLVTIAPPTTPVAPSASPGPWTWSFSSDGDGLYFPGDRVSFSGSGVPAGTEIRFELHSKVIALGTTTAAADGTFAFTTTIPADVEPGAHHFVLTATPPGELASVLEEALEIQLPLVEAVEDEPEPESELTASGSEGGSGGGGSTDRSDPAAPSILTGSLATLGHIIDNPFVLVLSAGLAIALLFLVAFPTEILNSTLSANTGRLGRGFVAIESRVERIKTWFLRVTRSRALASGVLVLVLSLIYGFTDPSFGWDLVSLRLVLSLAIGMFILTYVIGWFAGLLGRVAWGVHSQVEFQPAIAVFAVVGVVIARLLEFSPGFFVGVVIGLELIQAGRVAAARVTLIQFALVVAVAIGAWLGYSALASGGIPADFGGALLGDTLVALTAEGLTAAAIAILPLRFLEGRELYNESKPIWLVTFLLVEFAFVLLVLPTALEGTEVGDVGVWALVFFVFGVVTLALWATFSYLDRRRELELANTLVNHDETSR